MAGPATVISIRTSGASPATKINDMGIELDAAGANPHDLDTVEELLMAATSANLRTLAAAGTIIVNDAAAAGGTDIAAADAINYLANLMIAIAAGGSGGEAHSIAVADASGNFDHGGGQITNIADGTADAHAATVGQVNEVVAGVDAKGSVKAVNVFPQGTLSGLPTTVDGVGSWSAGDRILLVGEGTQETQDVTTIADVAGALDGLYFHLDTQDTNYYVWMNVDAGGNDPGPISGRTGVPVAVTTNDANTVVAASLQSALDALTEVSASVVTATVTVTHEKAGNVTDAADVDTGFTFPAATDGTGGLAGGNVNNGIWETAAGAWTRPSLFDTGQSAESAFVHVAQGTDYADTKWLCTSDDPNAVIDTDALTWTEFPLGGGGGGSDTIRKELQFGRSGKAVPNSTNPFYLERASGLLGSEVFERRLRAGTITGLALQVEAADASRNYELQIYKNGVETAITQLALSNSTGEHTAALNVAYNAGDTLAAVLVRTSGSGKSTFIQMAAIIEISETA